VVAKQEALVARLRGPNRDAELEGRLAGLTVPTLVLFGTLDRMIPPEMGRHYRERLANGHLVLVYDAAHAIGADRRGLHQPGERFRTPRAVRGQPSQQPPPLAGC
jgi:pimeloyl-ACP methyl ester carboxylesterase